jgi:uncharacterized protein YegL
VATSSPAMSFALSGNLAYVCGINDVSVVDVTNPAQPAVVATALSEFLHNSWNIHCSIQRNALSIFADQPSTLIGNNPAFIAFSLQNPSQPQLIKATPFNRRFFQNPVYMGNFAFVPTSARTYFMGVEWDGQFGDLLAVDLADFANPLLAGTLAQPQTSAQFGGPTVVLGATQADSTLLYLGGSTSTEGRNDGLGRLQSVDVTNPGAMKVVGQILIPGTIHLTAPLIQGTVAVAIGNTGGYADSISASPGTLGNTVVATFDVSDRRAPALLAAVKTAYKPGAGGGATRIGSFLFAYSGVTDANNNPVLLVVDIANPSTPVIQSLPLTQPLTSMQAVGTTLYATLGAAGFAAYSIPGVGSVPASSCPVSVDAVIVTDLAATMGGQTLTNGKTLAKSLVDTLYQPPDQVALVSFTTSASTLQPLTRNGALVKAALDGLAAGGLSHIGAGIAAAQAELTSARRTVGAKPVIILLSDGADAGAPNASATLAAASAAKAAGIRIISLQYGATATALMQAIASSSADFQLLGQ